MSTVTTPSTSPSLSLTELPGKGRSLISSKPLKGGEIILIDTPILLYSALPFSSSPHQHNYCSNCFKSITNPQFISCPNCPSTLFCSPNCLFLSLNSSHSPYICNALITLRHFLLTNYPNTPDLHIQSRFLITAYNLAAVSPSSFNTLMSLQGQIFTDNSAQFLHSLIASLCPPPAQHFGFSPELTEALLAKDKVNAFGLMEAFVEGGERLVRAYGIYPKASFFNHDCLPNACRFDYLDKDNVGDCNTTTDMVIRVLHDVPEGREICLSYFPVNFKYADRQKRLREDYGFVCDCDRCKVEANWSDDEEDGENEVMDDGDECDENDDMADEEGIEEGDGNDQSSDFPHAYFFIKYMCNRTDCGGTLAPLPPLDPRGNLMECNVCGNLSEEL